MIWPTILARELRSIFATPLAWVVLTLFLLVQGYSFYLLVLLLGQPDAPHGSPLQLFFGGTLLYWLFEIFIITALTMGLISRERQRGMLEALLCAPVGEAQLILGKYLAAVIFYAFLWLPTLLYLVLLRVIAGPAGLAWGPVAAGYLGTLTVGASAIAIGLFASTVARSQLVAAVLCFSLLSLLLLLGPLELTLSHPLLRELLAALNIFEQLESFARGVVDAQTLVFHFSLVIFFLVASSKALQALKWR